MRIIKEKIKHGWTYTRRTAFSFSSSSFFFCFSWFSLLPIHPSQPCLSEGVFGNIQPNVIGVQHTLDSSKLSSLLCFTLDLSGDMSFYFYFLSKDDAP
jgi:hypothetical protein